MPRYVALLRGVTPINLRMQALRDCFEAEGFTHVRTLLASGNVAFDARSSTFPTLERRAEKAMRARLGRSFDTIVRSTEYLRGPGTRCASAPRPERRLAMANSIPSAEAYANEPVRHPHSDDLFLVMEGRLEIDLADGRTVNLCIEAPAAQTEFVT